MSDYDDLRRNRRRPPPDAEIADFEPERFTRLEEADPIPDPNEDFGRNAPPRPPAPDPFEEFKVDQKPLSSLMDDLPSLDGLFKPFDLTSENPVSDVFEELADPARPAEFIYEDMDLRDPNVVRTLAQAEEKALVIVQRAEEEAARLVAAAATESRGLTTEAALQAEAILARARAEADSLGQAASHDRAAAGEARAEAEAQLTAAADRIAGLDAERRQMTEEFEARQAELETKQAAFMAENEAKAAAAAQEAKTGGHQEGLRQGLEEGRAQGRAEALKAFQERVDGLLVVFEKIDRLYDDLWAANGPMMVKLAIEAAEQILNKELATAEDLTVRAFMACIDYLAQANRVTFLARPQDIAQLEEARSEQRERLGALVRVTFQPDESLGPGDLIMESDVGRLDATVKHRTDQVMRALREAFAGTRGPSAQDAPDPADLGAPAAESPAE
ncbi:MAG: hypothetical protein LBS31_03385 [Candidatus Adiutrix sp.]|nr:hypothetical protein [Candidatus Adiutrix sp.]